MYHWVEIPSRKILGKSDEPSHRIGVAISVRIWKPTKISENLCTSTGPYKEPPAFIGEWVRSSTGGEESTEQPEDKTVIVGYVKIKLSPEYKHPLCKN